MAITIRPEAELDFDAIDRVVADAFESPAEAELVRRIRASPLYRPSAALVADERGEVVGHVMISGCSLAGPGRSDVIALLSPLAVAPHRQRSGIGGQLVRAVCSIAAEAGDEMVVLQGDPAYYGRFGFEPSTPLGVTMVLPDWSPLEAGQVLKLPSWSGTLAGHVELPDAFDGLD